MTDPRPAIELLRAMEWSMGNGQCPFCHGVPPSWFGHPLHLTPDTIGHKADCKIAAALFCLDEPVVYLGDFKSDKRYEACLTNGFLVTKIAGDPLRDDQEDMSRWTERLERSFLEHLMRKDQQ